MNGVLLLLAALAIALGVTALAILVYINIRARRLDGKLGAFRCWSRPDTQSGWTSGIGLYGSEELSWYRLVGFSNKPVYTLARRNLELSCPLQHSQDGSMLEIRLRSGEKRYEIAVAAPTYHALVSWIESGPPRPRA